MLSPEKRTPTSIFHRRTASPNLRLPSDIRRSPTPLTLAHDKPPPTEEPGDIIEPKRPAGVVVEHNGHVEVAAQRYLLPT